jgi:hypothetical protein
LIVARSPPVVGNGAHVAFPASAMRHARHVALRAVRNASQSANVAPGFASR